MSQDPTRFASLIALLLQLKRTRRTGWLDRGAPPEAVESIADHSYFTALIAWLVALDRPDLDAARVLQLAMIHDLAEAIVGDLPPYTPDDLPDPGDTEALHAFFSVRHLRPETARTQKREAEQAAIQEIARQLPEGASAGVLDLWTEYEARSTPEARFVKDVDTLEAFIESRSLAHRFPELPLWGFMDMAEREISDPSLIALRDAVLATFSPPGDANGE